MPSEIQGVEDMTQHDRLVELVKKYGHEVNLRYDAHDDRIVIAPTNWEVTVKFELEVAPGKGEWEVGQWLENLEFSHGEVNSQWTETIEPPKKLR